MNLYFLRHAHAEAGPDDAIRPLSDKGLKQCRQIGSFLRSAGVEFDRVCSSPLLRATETAETVLEAMRHSKKVSIRLDDALLNETGGFDRWLRGLSGCHHVLLVGHEPSMSARIAQLIGANSPEAVDMPKGALACVETTDGRRGTLQFLVSPKIPIG